MGTHSTTEINETPNERMGMVKIEFTHTHARLIIESDGHGGEPLEYRRLEDENPVITMPNDLEVDGVERDVIDDLVCELMDAHDLSSDLPDISVVTA